MAGEYLAKLIVSGHIAAGAIGGVHLANASIISGNIGANVIGGAHIANQGLTSANYASGSINGVHIANQSIVSSDVGTNVLGGPHLQNQSLISANYASGSLGRSHLAAAGVLSAHVASGSINGVHIANQSIVSSDIASGVIGKPHIAGGAVVSAHFASGALGGIAAIQYVIDGGGSPIQSGHWGALEVPWQCNIVRCTMIADRSGYIYPNIWHQFAASGLPATSSQTLTSSLSPYISSIVKITEGNVLSGWKTAIASGDILEFVTMNPASSIQRLTISLGVYR